MLTLKKRPGQQETTRSSSKPQKREQQPIESSSHEDEIPRWPIKSGKQPAAPPATAWSFGSPPKQKYCTVSNAALMRPCENRRAMGNRFARTVVGAAEDFKSRSPECGFALTKSLCAGANSRTLERRPDSAAGRYRDVDRGDFTAV